MPTNIEIKASVDDLEALRARALRLATAAPVVLDQHDIFFRARCGRLKLRIFDGAHGELIAYERSDTVDPQPSSYEIAPTSEPARLRTALAAALGEIGEVVKRRELIRIGQTRVHLDEVQDLGAFVELEVVLRDEDTEADGTRIARRLMKELGVEEDALVAVAYFDLLHANDPNG